MSDEVELEGKQYISSKRAASLSGYTQDYVGQLARAGHIDARRVSGLWYVNLDSVIAYKKQADEYKPEPPKRSQFTNSDPDSLISFDGRDYISAARASQITGYNVDYVGQLARSGNILARQVANRWFVEREGILAHKREKDALLAAVQAEAVGIAQTRNDADRPKSAVYLDEPLSTYTHDEGDLIPRTIDRQAQPIDMHTTSVVDGGSKDTQMHIPIHIRREQQRTSDVRQTRLVHRPARIVQPRPPMQRSYRVVAVLLACLAIGLPIAVTLGLRAAKHTTASVTSGSDSVSGYGVSGPDREDVWEASLSFVEELFVHEQTYQRQ